MKSRRKWAVLVFALVAFGCAPITSRALLDLSEREGEFYQKLQPALLEAKDTFRLTGDQLITGNAMLKASAMYLEAETESQAIWESLAVPNPSKAAVEKAIKKLVSMNTSVDAMVDKQKEAGKTKVEAVVKTFGALDTTLGTIKENHQIIYGYLKARRQIFGRPGSLAFLPFKTYAESRDHLLQSVKDLDDQFKLARDLVDAASEQFGEQSERRKP
jgi:hypothetical protein